MQIPTASIVPGLLALRRAAPVRAVALADGRGVWVRPVRPADAELHQAFVRALSPLARMRRFHGPVAELPAAALRYLTEVDQSSHVALLAQTRVGRPRQVAEARWVRRADEPDVADFAVAVADDYQRCGLGECLLDLLEEAARARGIRRLHGSVLRSNHPMIRWLARRGWSFVHDAGDASALAAERVLDDAVAARWREAA